MPATNPSHLQRRRVVHGGHQLLGTTSLDFFVRLPVGLPIDGQAHPECNEEVYLMVAINYWNHQHAPPYPPASNAGRLVPVAAKPTHEPAGRNCAAGAQMRLAWPRRAPDPHENWKKGGCADALGLAPQGPRPA